jgi:hypothetical protein
MLFIETPVFTALLQSVLTDDEYGDLQMYMAANPTAGDVIEATGGLRKLRWAAKSKGKRGGARVIYYFVCADDQIRLLLIYGKGVKDDLTEKEKKVLRAINAGWR